ncbi:galactose ABC transporter substrate-binding protein [Pseudoflavonifractor phocaeensis]|uniref:galactose ABC transporter substrate-binding protein n=1 Tax=Pseudoflavonifractor phocaeensis TaxID=1870988 RepID=UPI001956E4EF|nr:galactose ABC transporter substrate-binding protein [Pseudoflavonifractor phocaeensis]MBM6869967.1 galactose ABC transporter substrate-binding protein [Pseudoflavonifractor phocaeensis]
MKKKLLALLLALGMVASLAACSNGETTTSTAPSTAPSTESTAPQGGDTEAGDLSSLDIGVFYYQYSDAYITSVRTQMDSLLDSLGVKYTDYDGQNNQSVQTDSINTAIVNGCNFLIVNIVETSSPEAAQAAVDAAKNAGIPILFFNREVSDDVINSYEKCAFVGTDAAEAGHLQGQMIAEYLIENFDAVDLNGDGEISYVMFKGQEGNAEAEMRTQYSVEDANALLSEAGKGQLVFYNPSNTSGYLVDQTGAWSAQAATDYMNTILGEYSEANGNMVEMVIANNDNMAEGAISALQTAGYNTEGGKIIPVFGVDAMDSAKEKINAGIMTGTIAQDAAGMANSLVTLMQNFANDGDLMSNTGDMIVDEGVAKVRVPYAIYTGE